MSGSKPDRYEREVSILSIVRPDEADLLREAFRGHGDTKMIVEYQLTADPKEVTGIPVLRRLHEQAKGPISKSRLRFAIQGKVWETVFAHKGPQTAPGNEKDNTKMSRRTEDELDIATLSDITQLDFPKFLEKIKRAVRGLSIRDRAYCDDKTNNLVTVKPQAKTHLDIFRFPGSRLPFFEKFDAEVQTDTNLFEVWGGRIEIFQNIQKAIGISNIALVQPGPRPNRDKTAANYWENLDRNSRYRNLRDFYENPGG